MRRESLLVKNTQQRQKKKSRYPDVLVRNINTGGGGHVLCQEEFAWDLLPFKLFSEFPGVFYLHICYTAVLIT